MKTADKNRFAEECQFAKLVELPSGYGILILGTVYQLEGHFKIDEELNLAFVKALRNSAPRENSEGGSVSNAA